MKNLLLFSLLVTFILPINLIAQSKRTKKKKTNKKSERYSKVFKEKKDKPLKYIDFITDKTKTDKGLFNVHKTNNKFIYEIQKSSFGIEMLLVTRIKDIPSDLGGGYVNAGSKINPQVVVWEKFQDKILLKVISRLVQKNKSYPKHNKKNIDINCNRKNFKRLTALRIFFFIPPPNIEKKAKKQRFWCNLFFLLGKSINFEISENKKKYQKITD